MHNKPRYSQLLSDRRRQLGLSLSQAARVLRLKEQAISAFEEGRWEKIPRSGYAQAMLSSYARYLGLKPHDVIELFEQDLAEYSASVAAGRVVEDVEPISSGDVSHHPSFRKNQEDLYGSAGPAGSILTRSVFDATGPQPISYASKPENRYENASSVSSSAQSRSYLASGRPRVARTGEGAGSQAPSPQAQSEPEYTQENRHFGSTRTRFSASRATGKNSTSYISRANDLSGYADDLHYDQAEPYRSATSPEARSSMRTNINATRPNVRRRSNPSVSASKRPQKSGVAGVVEAWFSDSRRTLFTVLVLLLIILLLVISLSVASCGGDKGQPGARVPVPSQTTEDTSSQQSSDNSANDANASATSGDSATTDEEDAKPTEVTVEVRVDSGDVSWLEIKNGDKSVVAQTVTGPWQQSYTVDGALTIRANTPDAVHVTKDGKTVTFDSISTGIGTISITAPKPADTQDTSSDSTATTSQSSQSSQ